MRAWIVVGLSLLPVLTLAEVLCDFKKLRQDNQLADWAAWYIEKGRSGYERLFNESMSRVIEQNRRGCSLPASDPDSVLFRSGGISGRLT
jgi:hypothetical protein